MRGTTVLSARLPRMTDISPPLARMGDAWFRDFVAAAIESYAQENITAGRWPAEGARERARQAFAGLLPQGTATPDHFLYEIRDASGQGVGSLWFSVYEDGGTRQVHVYELVVAPAHRRRGHAEAAFRAMEAKVRAMGIDRIGLHVFAHNTGAQALYRKLGYGTASLNLTKRL